MQFSFGQSEIIAVLDFETPGGYTTTMTPHNNGNSIYFDRTDVTGIGPNYLNLQGNYFFGAQNIDGEPDNPSLLPAFLNIDDINIAGYTNLDFRVYIAEAADGSGEHWENINFPFFNVYNDYMHIDYDVDNSGAFSQLIWVEAAGNASSSNLEPRIDTDFNGLGDGTEITNAFTQFTQNIPGTGTFLDIQIEFSFDKQYEDIAIDNIEIWGTPTAQPEVDWCNIQFPNATQNIDLGDNFDVYAQVYEPGITDSAGEGTTIDAWIGYNTIDNDPEANDASWTWIPASYNGDSGNNDEYLAEIGSGLVVGTYYYASRFTLNGGSTYLYGGTGGIWNNDSVQLNVNSHEVDWCNLQYPPSTTINFGDSFDVFGRVYEPGITDTPIDQGAGILAWIGFSTTDATTTADFSTPDWTWVPANYNTLCPDCNDPTNTVENNDEYFVDIGPFIPGTGTYYYVTRFQYKSGPYSYGGYTAPVAPNPSGGNFWDGSTNISQILTVNDICTSTTTWDGTAWDNGNPDITKEVIINGIYDTAAPTQPSFSACSLTVSVLGSLTIDNLDYVEVNNNIINNGNITVRSSASVIQHNNNATVTGNDALVVKSTALLNNWYEYTYWSSPVSNETIGTGLFESHLERRYRFNANNFVDAQMETNNDNTLVPGQDDIDDDGNDWQYANATDTMVPGVGYAAAHNTISAYPNSFDYTFNGLFNNGEILVPVVRNDTSMADINWNFIGNPYPSAIDVDLFFAENNYDIATNPTGTLEGAIYLWSQNTPPSDNNNGNEGQNFTNSDYAIINATGVVPAGDPGGDGLTPNRFIPSGQGFFTAFSNTSPFTSGNVIFNNSMRVTGNNDQFFRLDNSSQYNKLSIKLTSDNGIFNQLLIGYVDGATNGYDGMYYDAPRNLSTGTSAIIYSIVEGNSRKFAIQGKDPNSLDSDEVISIGFKNTIAIDTQFTLSIADLEGDFMNSTSIYLRDNFLNNEHNLSVSNYTFTSDTGEFDERFEIYFSSTLSIDEFDSVQNQLIVTTNQVSLSLSTTHQSLIKKVKIYDMVGRLLFNIDGNNEATIRVNSLKLKNSICVVNVALADGQILTKKVLL